MSAVPGMTGSGAGHLQCERSGRGGNRFCPRAWIAQSHCLANTRPEIQITIRSFHARKDCLRLRIHADCTVTARHAWLGKETEHDRQ